MSSAALSESMQNYLKAVWALQEWSEEPATATEIARQVGVRVSTVSDALRKLSGLGLVEHARYGRVTLTEAGRAEAVAVVRRHRLLETFLVQVLGYSWDEVHDEAEVLEHAVSEKLVDRVEAYLGFPDRDPHGDPIPAADGTVTRPLASRLTVADSGSRVRVERISDAVPARLQYFAEHGVVVGAELEVAEAEPFSESVTVRVAGTSQTLSLGESTTDAVWVSPL